MADGAEPDTRPPTHRVPPEILAEIFERVPEVFPPLRGRQSPLALGLVCRYWRSTALSAPRLWNSFYLEPIDRLDDAALLLLWLGRSAEAPLFFKLDSLNWSATTTLFDTMLAHRRRWRDARITASLAQLARIGSAVDGLPVLDTLQIDPIDGPLENDLFEIISEGAAPRLSRIFFGERVFIWSIKLPWAQLTHLHAECFYPTEILKVFCFAPNLVSCNICVVNNREDRQLASVVMAHLRSLTLVSHSGPGPDDEFRWLSGVFHSGLTLPSLEVLRILYAPFEIDSAELGCLRSVLFRSECKLHKLWLSPSTEFLQAEAKAALPRFAEVIQLHDSNGCRIELDER
uniref:F-box domain-containing protein n=1 Tax=Mycena chlorophos TaxID=658473 RepID=A0ABQ0LLJ0_MYCCL|nr:predicted protein [Mycena chlorophos]